MKLSTSSRSTFAPSNTILRVSSPSFKKIFVYFTCIQFFLHNFDGAQGMKGVFEEDAVAISVKPAKKKKPKVPGESQSLQQGEDFAPEAVKSKRKQRDEARGDDALSHEEVISESRSKKKAAKEGAAGEGERDEGRQLSAEEKYITSILSKIVPLGSAEEEEGGERAESRLVPNVKKATRRLAKEFEEEATQALEGLSRPYATVLSIDGGGIRGYMPALWLQFIEAETKKHPNELFDFVGGTSIGGILSLGVSTPLETSELVKLFTTKGNRIFPQSKIVPRVFTKLRGLLWNTYSADPLEKLLKKYWGEQQLGALRNRVMVTSADSVNQSPVLFKSYEDQYRPCRIWEVARATSAAPTYFKAYPMMLPGNGAPRNLIDGGFYKNNPAGVMLREVVVYPESREKNLSTRDIIMVSLGTGKPPLSTNMPVDGGKLNSAAGAIDTIMNIDSLEVEKAVKSQLIAGQYLRINPRLARSIELDQATSDNLSILEEAAQEEYEALKASIDEGEIQKILEMGEDRFFAR